MITACGYAYPILYLSKFFREAGKAFENVINLDSHYIIFGADEKASALFISGHIATLECFLFWHKLVDSENKLYFCA